MFDQIQNVNSKAKNIYKDVLKSSQGLNSRDGKIEVYQYDVKDLEIAPEMISKSAVKEAIQEKREEDERTKFVSSHSPTNSLRTEIESPIVKSRLVLQSVESKPEMSVRSKRSAAKT